MALNIGAFGQIAVNRDAGIKNEALAHPSILLIINLIEIIENAPLQLINVREAKLQHQRGGFLAADTAGTKHCKRPILIGRWQRLCKLREFTETPIARIAGTRKSTHLDFILVPRVDDQRFRIVNERIPFLRRHMFAGTVLR